MYEVTLNTIGSVCGIAAREVVRGQYGFTGAARTALLREHVDEERNKLKKAYLLIDILFSPTFRRDIWAHSTVTEREVRNRLRTACPDFENASACGWGYRRTYNPSINADPTLPILLHGFGLNKEVARNDANWQPYHVSDSWRPENRIVRPALRTLATPNGMRDLVLSCSLISSAKCSTAAPLGFILNAPCWNIFALAPTDMQFPNDQAVGMERIAQARGAGHGRNNMSLAAAHQMYTTLAALIAETEGMGGDSSYNEVVVLGTSRLYMSTIKATGIFVKVARVAGRDYLVDSAEASEDADVDNSTRFYADPRMIPAIINCSNTNNLPIVPIRDPAMENRVTGLNFQTTFAGCQTRLDWNCPLN
jgi:hypothetical protein